MPSIGEGEGALQYLVQNVRLRQQNGEGNVHALATGSTTRERVSAVENWACPHQQDGCGVDIASTARTDGLMAIMCAAGSVTTSLSDGARSHESP